MQKEIPDFYNDLDKIYLKIWDFLNLGLLDRDSECHLPVFICGEGKTFDGRTVVLRGIDKKNKILWFHTDIRSKKIKILKINPNGSFLFYDKKEKIQLRIKVECTVHHNNETTKESWSKTGHISRKCYLVDNGPGTISPSPTSGLKPEYDNFEFTLEQSEEGYKNFTVIQCKIKSFEWLYLAAQGHRRAKFELDNNKEYWLVP